MNTLPYIVGPFSSEQIELLKKEPVKNLEVPDEIIDEIRKYLSMLKVP